MNIFDAKEALAEKYGLSKSVEEDLFEGLLDAVHSRELIVRNSSGLPYKPLHAEKHYYILELVSAGDLNAWLEKKGVEYRLDSPGQEQQGDDAPGKASKVDAKKEKIRAILGKIEAADGAFLREAMPGRKVDFFNLCKTLERESFVHITQATFNDYLPGLCKFMPGARETDYYRDIADKLG